MADLPYDQKNVQSTPGGIRTRSFRVESPASYPDRPQGQESSGGRARTCVSRLTVARLRRLDHTGMKRRQDSNLRTVARLRVSTAPPSAARPYLHESGRGGSRTLKALKPARFRDGVPHRWQPFQMAPAGVEPAPHRLRVGSSVLLSYEAVNERDRQGSNLRRLAFQASALPAELRSREVGGAGVEPAASCVSDRRSAA